MHRKARSNSLGDYNVTWNGNRIKYPEYFVSKFIAISDQAEQIVVDLENLFRKRRMKCYFKPNNRLSKGIISQNQIQSAVTFTLIPFETQTNKLTVNKVISRRHVHVDWHQIAHIGGSGRSCDGCIGCRCRHRCTARQELLMLMLMVVMVVLLLLLLVVMLMMLNISAVGMLRRVITIAIRSERRSSGEDAPTAVADVSICGAVGCDRINATALMVNQLRITVDTVSVQCHVAVGCAIVATDADVVAVDGGAVAVAVRSVWCCGRKAGELRISKSEAF